MGLTGTSDRPGKIGDGEIIFKGAIRKTRCIQTGIDLEVKIDRLARYETQGCIVAGVRITIKITD